MSKKVKKELTKTKPKDILEPVLLNDNIRQYYQVSMMKNFKIPLLAVVMTESIVSKTFHHCSDYQYHISEICYNYENTENFKNVMDGIQKECEPHMNDEKALMESFCSYMKKIGITYEYFLNPIEMKPGKWNEYIKKYEASYRKLIDINKNVKGGKLCPICKKNSVLELRVTVRSGDEAQGVTYSCSCCNYRHSVA